MFRLARIAVLVASAWSCHAQELFSNPRDPQTLINELDRATTVAVGSFRVSRTYPWFDGWHYSAAIKVKEFMYGGGKNRSEIPFRWTEHWGGTCLVCTRLSQYDGASGIWFLHERDGALDIVNVTHESFCGKPLPMTLHEVVAKAIRMKAPPSLPHPTK
jgi:hypothetical protein